ncbi:hypothetical protein NDI56_16820 [Haloarcula sp. S1CR25-12]|uniref:Phosphatidate cytidylyltransferase n=1 Tax=Haloarcula saliterrae TaxID=2950534 RepID=A0ABU2FGI3_9EURY|nr:hypothetical protein [Haloarcula sp. S1CR25-12]MDS0261063.1 hypothetical protein [Haloarcula sp. S1CR25-12]
MTALHTFRSRIRPGALLIVSLLVGAATYIEFVYYGPATLYAVILWIVVVPMLFAMTVQGVRDHPLYQPLVYVGFIAIGVLQFLADNWAVLAGVFVVAGLAGLASQLR